MEIKVHTVGRVSSEDRFNNWYVFIQTLRKSTSYLVLKVNNKMFGRDEKGNPTEGSEGYDDWMPDIESIEHNFEVRGWKIEWLDDPKPEWLDNEV